MVWLSQLAGVHTLALMSLALPSPEAERYSSLGGMEVPTLWAGHQVTFGRREVPFKGEVETRMDSFVLARLSQDGDFIELDQTACHVRFSKVAGVTVHMNAETLPRTRFLFSTAAGPSKLEGRSIVAWSSDDIDDDGNPGATVRVQAPVCSGELYVANISRTKATASIDAEHIRGRAKVHVKQQVLGAKGACLSAVAKDTDEHQSGPFAYVPVPEGTTCETLLEQGWPVTAK